jgi:hypothetical protein
MSKVQALEVIEGGKVDPETLPRAVGSVAFTGGGGGGEGRMEIKDYIDAQDEKTRAQNEAAFANQKFWMIGSVAIGTFAVIGAMISILSFGGDRYQGGIEAGQFIAEGIARGIGESNRLIDERLTRVEDALISIQDSVNEIAETVSRTAPAPEQE